MKHRKIHAYIPLLVSFSYPITSMQPKQSTPSRIQQYPSKQGHPVIHCFFLGRKKETKKGTEN